MSALMRALLAGQLGMAILFGLDALDSTRLFRRSTQRIRTDAETLALLTGAVTDYAVRIAVAHAVLGLLLAGLLHWGVRFSSPRPPSGWRWWASAGLLFVLLCGMGHAQQLYNFQAMYDVVRNVAGLLDSVSLTHALSGAPAIHLEPSFFRSSRIRPFRSDRARCSWAARRARGWPRPRRAPVPRGP